MIGKSVEDPWDNEALTNEEWFNEEWANDEWAKEEWVNEVWVEPAVNMGRTAEETEIDTT